MAWLYVPGLEGSNSGCTCSSATTTALSVTSSGKPMRRPLSWPGWKTRPWLRLLSGTIYAPSTAARGVDSFISSLRATPASRSARPEDDLERLTRAISGPTCDGLLSRYARRSSSSKTYQTTFDLGLPPCEPSYGAWVIGLRRDSTARLRSALRTDGSGSSSWPTARAEDAESAGRRAKRGVLDTLTATSRAWATPREADSRGTPYQRDRGRKGSERLMLSGQARTFWSTPNVPNGGRAGSAEVLASRGQTERGKRQVGLETEVRHWPTPAARDCKGANARPFTERGGGRRQRNSFRTSLRTTGPRRRRPTRTSSPGWRSRIPLRGASALSTRPRRARRLVSRPPRAAGP